ncbi:MAG: fibronectin type III domain-containing protein, partial [Haliangium ochraceum]
MRKAACLLVFLAACGDDGPPTDDPLVLDGGRITVAGCDYEVITRVDAEEPALGADVLGADPDPIQVHLGLGGDPKTSMVILWRTDVDTTSTIIKYGEGASLDETAAGVTYIFVAGVGGVGDALRMHEGHLCGLQPGTEYSYQVGGVNAAGDEHFSPTYTFHTAPDITASPDAEVTIAYSGDTRNGYDAWSDTASQILQHTPDLLVYTGDIVTLGPLQSDWDGFFEAAPELYASVPLVSAHGNHEINSISYYAQLAMPGDEENYAFDYGHLHQIVVNTDPTAVGDLFDKIP